MQTQDTKAARDAMREALEEIIRNVEPWKTADNMAGRLHEIASNALAPAKGERTTT